MARYSPVKRKAIVRSFAFYLAAAIAEIAPVSAEAQITFLRDVPSWPRRGIGPFRDHRRYVEPICQTPAYGYEPTSGRPNSTSALPPKADIPVAVTDFRL